MDCHDGKGVEVELKDKEFEILLMGNPNVGKSVIFSKLTGMNVLSANYTGTTVSYTKGILRRKDLKGILIDVPGTYSLEATSKAEEVALDFLKKKESSAIICVLDATNIERNINFALKLRSFGLPIVFALNLSDVAEQQGVYIDTEALSEELGCPVIRTVAVRNIGLIEVIDKAIELSTKANDQSIELMDDDQRWQRVGAIVDRCVRTEHRHPTTLERLGNMMLKPFPGLLIAALVLVIALGVVVGGGKALRAVIFLPIVNNLIVPFFRNIVSYFTTEGLVYNVLVGEYGVLVKGIEWPFALILPYVSLFYVVLSFLEDSGYLPRLGVLVDSTLRRVGVNGGNIVPFIMGYGCAVPAILGTRASTSYKERLIVSSLVALAVPCAAQTGAFIALLGDRSIWVLLLVYMISFIAILGVGMLLRKLIPGKEEPMLLEIPNLLSPDAKSLGKKIWIRTKSFMVEAEVPMMLGVGFAALVAETGMLVRLSEVLAPLTSGWLGLPPEATLGLLLGVIRRELAVLPMLELNLSTLQLLVGAVVALFYIPCLAVLGVMIKEFGIRIALAIGLSTIIIAFLAGGIINHGVRLVASIF